MSKSILAFLLRNDAELAKSDGGRYYSGPSLEEYAVMAEALDAENAELREACAELLRMAESHDPEWPYWPELHDELRKLGVEIAEL